MFDWYEPVPALVCPSCGDPLSDWQGKDATCRLWTWRQGETEPHHDAHDAGPRSLPATFAIHTQCSRGHWVDAVGEAREGTWTTTTLLTPPVRPTQDAAGHWSCPCCGRHELPDEPPGTFDVCGVCGWEDDRVQFEDVDYAGGANDDSMRSARRAFVMAQIEGRSRRSR